MTKQNGVAIIGYAARLPGAADNTEFWDVLTNGRDTTSVVPDDRWDADEFYDADADAPGKMISRRAGFVDDVTGFDASFFGVSAREAMYMDPQHRLMLEITWSAIEHAGIAPSALAGSRTGVFMGLSTHEFLGMLIRYSSYESVDIYSGTGTSPAAGAGRISFRLGLVGPAVVVDTACSSSLVAVHQACLALEAGDCDMALVGGVNVILTPVPMINLTRARMLAPDGHCKTFDAAADGYVRGEGCGVVVLKRVGDAHRDGDHIRAIVRGSAVNQDGASGGLTVPNGIAQQQVIADALRRSGLSGRDVDYLEAHGTGTSLGDPIEVQAASAVFGTAREADRPLLIGSVKTNIGHLEAASGIAGLIKVVLSLENEVLPKHLHFHNPSPHIPWDSLSVRVVDNPMPWQRNGKTRVAGVSSFGFSGTNAHVLVEEAPPIAPATPAAHDPGGRRYHVLPLSARSPEALTHVASRYRDWLDANPEAAILDVCATAGAGRSHFEHRAALVVNSRTRARRLLAAVHEANPSPGLFRGVSGDRPKTVWLFPGQGSQYPGMAKGLFDSEPVFADTLRRCAGAVDGVLPQPLLDVVFGDDAKTLSHTAFAQTALFAVEMGLAELWHAWGITPDVVLGHSVGQYAAACVAGILSLDDGIRLVAERGRLFGALPDGGRMVAVFADSARVEELAADFPRVSVAGYNGASTVLSGSAGELDRVTAPLSAAGIRCEWLDTSHAFHSALLDPALDEFESYAGQFTYHEPRIALVCNRTGQVLSRQARIDAQYWRRHARQPVRFADSVHTVARLGCTALMELGPQPILTAAALRIWPDSKVSPQAVASLRRDVDARRCFSEALAAAYAAGHPLDFAGRYPGRHRLDLPTYPFQRRPYWFPTTAAPLPSVEIAAPDAVTDEAPRPGHLLADASPDDMPARIDKLIRDALAESLRMPADGIPGDAEFMALGMDSLIAMELRRRMQAALGTDMPVAMFFTHPTVPELTQGLLQLWRESSVDPARRQAPIPRMLREGCDLPISHAQEQLWFLAELLPSSRAYNVAICVDIAGTVNRDFLRRSLEAVVHRHEALRTAFSADHGIPGATALTPRPFDLPYEELGPDGDIEAAGLREADRPFDLGSAPLLRARLFGLGRHRQALVLTMHHIVTDGWSFRVLLRDLARLYQAFESGEAEPLSQLPIQYADYAQWQREQLCGNEFDAHLDFWKRDLAGAPPLQLDTDRPRPKNPTFRGERLRFELGHARAAALRTLCRTENVTLIVPLLGAFATVLQRYSGSDDMVIGTLSANRGRLETEDLIGLFVNALPVRVQLGGDPDVGELLDRIRHRVVEVLAHQDVPFDLIVNATAPDRAANRNPLFGVQLVVQPSSQRGELSGHGLAITEVDTRTAKRDLTLTVFDDESISGHLEFASDLFDEDRIHRLLEHFFNVVDAMCGDRHCRIAELDMLTEPELGYYRKARVPTTGQARSVPELFEATVDRTPDAVAVEAIDGELTYRQVDDAANRLARWLQSAGATPGTAVGLSVNRTTSTPIGMLAILKAGCVYVPIDPSYPEDRITHIRTEAAVRVVVDDDRLSSPEVHSQLTTRPEIGPAADDVAYVMFTSGSTGRPKGVAISHGSVVEYAQTLGRELGIVETDVVLETASISFSSSIRQLLIPFATGARVVIATHAERRDPAALLRRVKSSSVTVADLVPTVVRRIADTAASLPNSKRPVLGDSRLRLLLTASEPLRAGDVRAWQQHVADVEWVNMYGQTETTGIVSLCPVGIPTGGDQAVVPIGRPRGNIALYVLDDRLRRLPAGVSGQMYISGAALAREYLNAPDLTAARFVVAPWDPAERLYASGDVVRLRQNGTIDFRGRADRQVKIRGLRVEPAEVDRVMLEHPGVREAVTTVQRSGNGSGPDDDLVTYYVPAAAPVPAAELREHARLQLPDQMVPSAFMSLEALPQTSNGKLDRAALPVVEIARDEDIVFVAPRPGVEQSLAEIWCKTLHLDQVGAGDNFFSLGGHSLLAAQLRSQIQLLLGVDLPLDTLFENQTLAALARRIEQDLLRPDGTGVADVPPLTPMPRSAVLPASYAQQLMWQAEGAEPGSPAHWIDVSVRISGPLETGVLVSSVQGAVARHELLRTVFRPANGVVSQVILDPYVPDVPVYALGEVSNAAVGAVQLPDLGSRPPFHAELTRIAEDHHELRLRVHRTLADGYTMRLLLSEIGGMAAQTLGLDDFPLLDGDLQYADYAAWERSWLTDVRLARRIDHFSKVFDLPLPPPLPTDHPRNEQPTRVGGQHAFEFPPAVADAVRALALREQASLYSVLLAGFAAAVGRYARQSSVVIAASVMRRDNPATQLIMGPFMNTVPLHIDLADTDLTGLVNSVKGQVVLALANQDAPWQLVLDALTARHGLAARGIGETVFLMDDPVPGKFAAGQFTLTRVPPERVVARRELTVAMSTRARQISGTVTYDNALFEPETINRLVTDFIAVLSPSPAQMPGEPRRI